MAGGSWQIAENLFADLYVQYYSNWQTKFQTDRHNQNIDWSDAAWTTFYGGAAKDLAVVLQLTKGPGFEKQHAIAQILKVYFYQRITDYWGPIPYLRLIITSAVFLTIHNRIFMQISLSSSIQQLLHWQVIPVKMLMAPMTRSMLATSING